uniref:Uncharacterized protein n=1 Tax=viral metagenome TaxID=1070528 RepID=A0A6C0JH86_9ZZZZ
MSYALRSKVSKFSWDHYHTINRVGGDEDFKELIEKCFPSDQYSLACREDEEFGDHHHVINKKTNKVLCSLELGYQNPKRNRNDTLCQSWSLLIYFDDKIVDDQYINQITMIKRWKYLLTNPHFIKECKSKRYFIGDLYRVLHNWEKYGYLYFMGKGVY